MDCRLFACSSVAASPWDVVHGRAANKARSQTADRENGEAQAAN